jgi:hypothetical protein
LHRADPPARTPGNAEDDEDDMKPSRENRSALWTFACALAVACADGAGEGDRGAAGREPTAGTSSGTGAGAAAEPLCLGEGEPNADCPAKQPLDGPCAPRGQCCQRTSNAAKAEALNPDAPLVLEYRVQSQLTQNHPGTIGSQLIVDSQRTRYDNQSQNLLWRFELPRKDGRLTAGPGRLTTGYGVYNCDGTYGYYGDAAAPDRPASSDPARWSPRTADIDFDPDERGIERMAIAFADNTNRKLVYLPYLVEETFALDWELVNQGFSLLEIELDDSDRDCVGSRAGGLWVAGGTFEVFTPLDRNDEEVITSIGQTYCQLVAFGLIAAEDAARLDCGQDTQRCEPGSQDCAWKKLPDSLCPVDERQMSMWGCHLGAEGNPNREADYPAALSCTPTEPTSVLDPDAGETSRGQCCDPLGVSATLPACNAYRLIQAYVAAAAEITDEPVHTLQQQCP